MKWESFMTFYQSMNFDAVICTGDFSSMGCRGELLAAHEKLQPFLKRPDFILMPGNHDVYLPGEEEGYFNDLFADYYRGDFLRLEGGSRYPFAKIINEQVAIVAVNSVKPNPLIWRSSGRVALEELEALKKLCAHPELRARRLLVATHYNVDEQDTALHGLENRSDFRAALVECGCAALLHGHIHHEMIYDFPEAPIPVFGAGSLTYRGRETFHVLEIDETIRCRTGFWDGRQYCLR